MAQAAKEAEPASLVPKGFELGDVQEATHLELGKDDELWVVQIPKSVCMHYALVLNIQIKLKSLQGATASHTFLSSAQVKSGRYLLKDVPTSTKSAVILMPNETENAYEKVTGKDGMQLWYERHVSGKSQAVSRYVTLTNDVAISDAAPALPYHTMTDEVKVMTYPTLETLHEHHNLAGMDLKYIPIGSGPIGGASKSGSAGTKTKKSDKKSKSDKKRDAPLDETTTEKKKKKKHGTS